MEVTSGSDSLKWPTVRQAPGLTKIMEMQTREAEPNQRRAPHGLAEARGVDRRAARPDEDQPIRRRLDVAVQVQLQVRPDRRRHDQGAPLRS